MTFGEEPHTRREEVVERRLAEARADARALAQQNERLNRTLREARESLLSLREQLEALAAPPAQFGVVVARAVDGTADVSVSGRVLRVKLADELVDPEELRVGTTVLLNEAMTVVGAASVPPGGEIVRVREALPDGRVLVAGASDEEIVLQRAVALADADLQPGDSLLADRRAFVALDRVQRSDLEELRLDDVPDVTYDDIGGLGEQIEAIRDAVELPFKHRDLFADFRLSAPKGVLLYGPPGCGKTMIAKAVANAADSHFLNIKGPELLNKYVGETERQVRVIFGRARELAVEGRPVVIFFDEMDSLFRTRGSGVSSDVESTVVPQLLSEIDGVEQLHNVIIIGATNREDLIDPAILRPGRLDVKIRLDRPDPAGAREILARYLTTDVPLNPSEAEASGGAEAFVSSLLDDVVDALYERGDQNRFVEVTYASGEKEVLYVADFVSGAMLAAIVGRAKKAAIKEVLAGGERGIRRAHLLDACRAEVAENEELPNTTNPDDWAKVSGRRGERIVYLRTLASARAIDVG
ncbi:proteasome ATPase [Nigerium massiliense]|uniref:proteasome ATPase n=1 Tax=Nigerium massiliense TaxID=1522317 RepID=UPI0006940ED1|nr:proteasome ATPase [Nigerium massiliense]